MLKRHIIYYMSLSLLRLKKISQIILDLSLFSALLKGVAAGVEHSVVLKNIKCDLVVDIGANRGQFALIARKIFPDAKILSFEPLREPAQIFSKVFDGDPHVTLYPCAIGGKKNITTMHVTKNEDSSSILPLKKMQVELFPGSVEKEMRRVTVYPLSIVMDPGSILPFSLLKIDVQGYEMEVLKGCQDILDRFSYIYVECSFVELYEGQALAHQIIAWLAERSFILSSVNNIFYGTEGLAVQGDFLFSRTKLVD